MIEHKNAVTITGITKRTSNSNLPEIGQLWQEFMKLGEPQKEVYAVYSNYESDYTGSFNLTIGTVDGHGDTVLVLPEGKYEKIDVQGDSPAAIGKAWSEIWNSNLPRTYQYDFELYQKDKTVSIYLSVK